jgi:hypothetical protein
MSGMHQPIVEQMELFNDEEDQNVQARNRAVEMYNMADEHSHEGMVSAEGMVAMLTYLDAIPPEERAAVVARLTLMMEETPVQ